MRRPSVLGASSAVIQMDEPWLGFALTPTRVGLARRRVCGVCVCMLFLVGCSVGKRHTSDSVMEQNFLRHEVQFEELRAYLQTDENLEMVGLDEVRYVGRTFRVPQDFAELQRLGLPKARWDRYQRLLRELGIVQAFRGRDTLSLKVDGGSISNGDSYKGYEYALVAPQHQRGELDTYRISESDRDESGNYYLSKHLKGHWCLYLFVSGRR